MLTKINLGLNVSVGWKKIMGQCRESEESPSLVGRSSIIGFCAGEASKVVVLGLHLPF